jgi:hypothetical protein
MSLKPYEPHNYDQENVLYSFPLCGEMTSLSFNEFCQDHGSLRRVYMKPFYLANNWDAN